MLNLKYITALLIVMGLLVSCSDDKSSTSPDDDNGTGSNGPGEVILFTEIEYSVQQDYSSPEVVSYDQEVHAELDFSTQGTFQENEEKFIWTLDNSIGGNSNFGFNIKMSVDELTNKQYTFDNGDNSLLDGSMVYLNGKNNEPTQVLRSNLEIDSYIVKEVDSRDYNNISGSAEFYLNAYYGENEQIVIRINFKNLNVELFE